MDLFEFDKTAFSVCDLHDLGNELEFWLSRTPEERLAAVEYLRQMTYGYDPAIKTSGFHGQSDSRVAASSATYALNFLANRFVRA
ncbi:MAG: hypothetical protein HYZ00_08165 [Candidatus Hydrogenedentes bacterium]|nr:hypothetical protein [Candidatus Hydrogenedentota bacterium]